MHPEQTTTYCNENPHIVLKENEKIEMSKDIPASEGIKNVPLENADKEVATGLLAAVRKHK